MVMEIYIYILRRMGVGCCMWKESVKKIVSRKEKHVITTQIYMKKIRKSRFLDVGSAILKKILGDLRVCNR